MTAHFIHIQLKERESEKKEKSWTLALRPGTPIMHYTEDTNVLYRSVYS